MKVVVKRHGIARLWLGFRPSGEVKAEEAVGFVRI